MMKTLLEEFRPHVWVNVHSGMEALFMPFDHKAEEPVGPGADAMKAILRQINATTAGTGAWWGGGKGVGYLAHGTATDHVYVKMRVPPFNGDLRHGAHYWTASACSTRWSGTDVTRWSGLGQRRGRAVPMTRAHGRPHGWRAAGLGEAATGRSRASPPRTSTRSSARRSSTARRPPSPARVWTRASMPHSQRPRWTPPLESTRRARARSSGAGVRFGTGGRDTSARSSDGAGFVLAAVRVAVRRRDRRGERLSAVVCRRADGLRGVRRGGPRVPVRWRRACAARGSRAARDRGREEALAVAALSASARSPFREQGPRGLFASFERVGGGSWEAATPETRLG